MHAAQQAIDEWVAGYNHQRPHQALDMAVPVSRFRPNGPTRPDLALTAMEPSSWSAVQLVDVPAALPSKDAVELDTVVPPTGEINLLQGRQRITMTVGLAGRTVTVWADTRSVHVSLDGHRIRTMASKLTPADLEHLRMRGARPAGPEPGAKAVAVGQIIAGQAVEIDRRVRRDGYASVVGHDHYIGTGHAGENVVLRLDGHLMHAIADSVLIGTWPSPLPAAKLGTLRGARVAATALPPPALPTGSIRVHRRVHSTGRIMVANQPLKLGRRHVGKTVTVVIEDTHFRILHGDEEIAVKARRDTGPVTRLYVKPKSATADEGQASPDDRRSRRS